MRIVDFADAEGLVVDQAFSDQVIVGPAVLLPLRDVSFRHVRWGIVNSDPETILHLIEEQRQTVVLGCIILVRCKFERCDTENIGVAGPRWFLDQFRAAVGGRLTRPGASGGQTSPISITNINTQGGPAAVGGQAIQTGDIHNVGQLSLGGDVVTQLQQAGRSELAAALQEYLAVLEDEPAVSDEERAAQADLLSEIGREAARPTPNTTRLKILGGGLMRVAEATGRLATAADSVLDILDRLPH